MKHARRVLALSSFVLLALAGPVRAQYMWLDSDGNEINDPDDRLNPIGVPTTVDVYLDTNHRKDGSAVICDIDPSMPLSIYCYYFCATLTNGTAAFSGFQNGMPTMTLDLGADSSSTEYVHGFANPTPIYPPGIYHLARFTVTLLTSTGPGATLNIVPQNSLAAPFFELTMFQSQCEGLDFDNTYKMGPNTLGSTDWTDTAGLLSPSTTTAVPVSTVPAGKLAVTAAPNPLNPSTELKFTTSRAGRVTLRIFDLEGQLVKVLTDEEMSAGPHALRWDGSDAAGGRVSSGVYFVRLSASEGEAVRIVTVVK